MHLSPEDEAVLAALAEGPASLAELAAAVDQPRDRLAARVDELVDGGVACETPAGYALTDSGRRALAAPGDGSADDGIDVPAAAERAIGGMGLRADRAALVRSAVARLRDWGRSSRAELVDELYGENDAGFDDPDAWWATLADALARVPGVIAPEDRDADDADWRYAADHDEASDGAGSGDDHRDGPGDDGTDAPPPPDDVAASRGQAAGGAVVARGADERCPVCGRPYAGRVYIEASGTVLPGRPGRTCVAVTPAGDGTADDGAPGDGAADVAAGLTLFYHRRRDG